MLMENSRQLSSWPAGRWFIEHGSADDLCAFRCVEILAEGRTQFQEYAIIVSPVLGKALILDGVLQSAQSDEFIYHEALVQPALCSHDAPQRVAVLGGGEGATIREVLRHATVQTVFMIDLDAELVELCRRLLPEFAAGAWDEPRLQVLHTDGRAWLAAQPDASLDVIIMDITDPLEGGPAYFLFTREMFGLAQRKLRAGGVMSIQAGSAGQAIRLLPHLHRTLRTVFPQVIPYTAYIPSFNDQYGFMMAGGTACRWPTPERVSRILAERGVNSFRWFEPDFALAPPLLPSYLRQLLAREGQILTDAQPFRQIRPFSINL
jgi:spermidine synthase